MKWVNHIAITSATCAVVAPTLVPVAILGSTAPDWIEFVLKFLGRETKHRQETHYLSHWVIGFIFFFVIWDFHSIGAAFCYGGFIHVITDSFTVTGVPLSPLSDRRFHLFGGRLRTGDPAEYMIAGGVVFVCAVVAWTLQVTLGFYPFFYDWAGLYGSGIIDGSEWRTNRFKFL